MKLNKNEEAVSPVIAVMLMVAVTVILAATIFILVSDIKAINPSPTISLERNGNNLTVISAPYVLDWPELSVSGCTNVPQEGRVEAGDIISGCQGKVFIVHLESNTIIFREDF